MRSQWSEKLKQTIRPIWYRIFSPSGEKFRCPICNYEGVFKDKLIRKKPYTIRVSSKCLGCGATERHRMMYLVIEELSKTENFEQQKVLHIAPEDCLGKQLDSLFGTYETADLFKKNVDHKEDVQNMSFADNAFDWVVISRVLTVPPNLEACLDELRRIVRPGGVVIIAEIYTHAKTVEFGKMINARSREIGVDLLEELKKRFATVEQFASDRYDARYQLLNRMIVDGTPKDDYPDLVKVDGVGFKDLVAVCRA